MSAKPVSEPIPIPLRTFSPDETRAILEQRLPPADAYVVFELISDFFFNNGTVSDRCECINSYRIDFTILLLYQGESSVDVDVKMGYGLARLRKWNATIESSIQAYAAALRQYLHSTVNVDQIAEAFVKFSIPKNDKELSEGKVSSTHKFCSPVNAF